MKHANPLYVTAALWEVLRLGLLYFAIAGTALVRVIGNMSALVLVFGAPQLVVAAMLIMIFVDKRRYLAFHAPIIAAKILSILPLIYVILTSLRSIAIPGDSRLMVIYRAYLPLVILVIDAVVLKVVIDQHQKHRGTEDEHENTVDETER